MGRSKRAQRILEDREKPEKQPIIHMYEIGLPVQNNIQTIQVIGTHVVDSDCMLKIFLKVVAEPVQLMATIKYWQYFRKVGVVNLEEYLKMGREVEVKIDRVHADDLPDVFGKVE